MRGRTGGIVAGGGGGGRRGAGREEEGGERQGEGDRDDKEEKAAGAMSPGLRAATVKTGFPPTETESHWKALSTRELDSMF